MSFSIVGTKITLTRGDTLKARISIYDQDKNEYTPREGDSIRFAMKRTYADVEPLIVKEIPTDTMLLVLDPQDTKTLAFGKYVYDIQLTTASGDVDTFITKAQLHITEEVL